MTQFATQIRGKRYGLLEFHGPVDQGGVKCKPSLPTSTAVRLKVEENQLVDVFSEIGIHIDALKGR